MHACYLLAVIIVFLTLHDSDDVRDVRIDTPKTGLQVQIAVAQIRMSSAISIAKKWHDRNGAVQLLKPTRGTGK